MMIRSATNNGDLTRIANIQVLRAFAATCVVYLHSTLPPGLAMPAYARFGYGQFGVDLFFVISGFVISSIAIRDPRNFELKRIIRIVPFYWAATLGVFVITLLFPQLVHHTFTDWQSLLTSLFFIPQMRPNGSFEPTLYVGWTLDYEMYFYAIFAVALRLSRRNAPLISAAAIVGIMAVAGAVSPGSPAGRFYGNSIVVEFVYGIVVFQLVSRISIERHNSGRPLELAGWLFGASAALALLLWPWETPPRWECWGLPAALLLACVVLCERRFGAAIKSRAILLAGDGSYVLYLIHPYIIYGLLRFPFRGADLWPRPVQWALVAVLIASSIAVSIVIHLYFELPVMRRLRQMLPHKPVLHDFRRPGVANAPRAT